MTTTCANHTAAPESYMGWHAWADRMSKTHAQVKCQECGLWSIWLPKREARIINKREEAETKAVVPHLLASMARKETP